MVTQSRARIWPKSRKRAEIHRPDAESIDETTTKGSNHPKIDSYYPFRPLNLLHPLADGEAMAAGFKKQILRSFSSFGCLPRTRSGNGPSPGSADKSSGNANGCNRWAAACWLLTAST
jgi:hypothetical protein